MTLTLRQLSCIFIVKLKTKIRFFILKMDSNDNNDILDDKDSGPEVQLNLPGSVISRIEELMGGTEQFDSEEVSFKHILMPTYSYS